MIHFIIWYDKNNTIGQNCTNCPTDNPIFLHNMVRTTKTTNRTQRPKPQMPNLLLDSIAPLTLIIYTLQKVPFPITIDYAFSKLKPCCYKNTMHEWMMETILWQKEWVTNLETTKLKSLFPKSETRHQLPSQLLWRNDELQCSKAMKTTKKGLIVKQAVAAAAKMTKWRQE